MSILPFFFMCCFCFLLSFTRFAKSGTTTYIFLNANLFLAAIPLVLSTWLVYGYKIGKVKGVLIFSMWLLFFPNAPYILTDIIHFRKRISAPVWFDMAIIHCFSLTALFMGLKSLNDIEHWLGRHMKPLKVHLFITAVLFLCAFGIYVGRFLRWHSIHLFIDPMALITDIATRIFHPFQHPKLYGVTFIFGVLLNMAYWSVKLIVWSDRKHTMSRLNA